MHMCEIQLATIGALKSYKDYDKDCKTYSQGIGKWEGDEVSYNLQTRWTKVL